MATNIYVVNPCMIKIIKWLLIYALVMIWIRIQFKLCEKNYDYAHLMFNWMVIYVEKTKRNALKVFKKMCIKVEYGKDMCHEIQMHEWVYFKS